VLGETVLDRVVLEQLKAYIRGGGGDQDVSGGDDPCGGQGMVDGVVRDLDNLSVSSSDEADKFEDACGDVSATVTQLDRLEKHANVPQKQRTMLCTDSVPPMIRTPAEGLDAAAAQAQAQAKLKDRPVTKGKN